MPAHLSLDELLLEAANQAVDKDGFTRDMLDDRPGGNVHQWCARNIDYRKESEFYVVVLVCGAIADRLARDEGYESNVHRAAQIAWERDHDRQEA